MEKDGNMLCLPVTLSNFNELYKIENDSELKFQ